MLLPASPTIESRRHKQKTEPRCFPRLRVEDPCLLAKLWEGPRKPRDGIVKAEALGELCQAIRPPPRHRSRFAIAQATGTCYWQNEKTDRFCTKDTPDTMHDTSVKLREMIRQWGLGATPPRCIRQETDQVLNSILPMQESGSSRTDSQPRSGPSCFQGLGLGVCGICSSLERDPETG